MVQLSEFGNLFKRNGKKLVILKVIEMLDIPSISAVVAAAGVIIGVVLTVIELRNLVKQRQKPRLKARPNLTK